MYSPEPWSVEIDDWGPDDERQLRDAKGVRLLNDYTCGTEDAERICACVNACQSIPINVLESGWLREILSKVLHRGQRRPDMYEAFLQSDVNNMIEKANKLGWYWEELT